MRKRPGAFFDGTGVEFALPAPRASKVELCLFDAAGGRETARAELARDGDLWRGRVPGLGPGAVYGYRVHGPSGPGDRFDPSRALFDPWARAVGVAWPPLAAVAAGGFDWGDDRPPRRPWRRALVYELHVKGFTKLHPDVPERLRGTYAGLAHPAVVAHLKDLGVTAVELLPVQFHVDEAHLRRRGLSNYWGYSPLGFFAPDPRYAADPSPEGCVREFKAMVKALHEEGLEVILDVVYNHTGEGEEEDPPLSLKGVDNAAYYRLDPADPSRYEDMSGCRNTLDARSPAARALVLESLRYWAGEMRVDGFRFDLATVLGRGDGGFDPRGPLLSAIGAEPLLKDLKLIAEPWDPGPDGYRLGAFPPRWAEWNGKYRDCARRLWRGDAGMVGEFATRLSGSSDLFDGPLSGVNYVCSHDGFTLRDLVSYSAKRNEANGEGNRDGESENFSFNCGAEGETGDPAVLALRRRQMRNLLATLLLSEGVPMLCAGDEFGRTQRGNNNPYCLDDEASWVDWKLEPWQRELLGFVRELARLRRRSPVFERGEFFRGAEVGPGLKDVSWHGTDGRELSEGDWLAAPRSLAARMAARPGDAMLLLFNPDARATAFMLPPCGTESEAWELVLDTAHESRRSGDRRPGARYDMEGRSMAVMRGKRT